ncbi:MAG TPA: Sua5/YciO/YrdC/YwlC family protein, partial [Chitinophagaceae bacterium]|nr:Sua5/YciO/YrdC/YwlC family protein [Chitinophagaceae bacterium]
MRTAYENDIKQAVSVMQQGGVILYPTDTIWGLGCDATQPEAVEKIFHIKGRDAGKSVIVLMTDFKQLLQYLANPLPDLESI